MALRSVIRCTLSGSFRRDKAGIESAYAELVTCGCQVLSPHRLDFDSDTELFVRDTAEQKISEASIEAHHLLAIKQSDFVWLHLPGGYLGPSAALEVGYAVALGVPLFASQVPSEKVFRSFVTVVPSVYKALETIAEEN